MFANTQWYRDFSLVELLMCTGSALLPQENSAENTAQLLGFLLFSTAESLDTVLRVYGGGSASSETAKPTLAQLKGPAPVLRCLTKTSLGGYVLCNWLSNAYKPVWTSIGSTLQIKTNTISKLYSS